MTIYLATKTLNAIDETIQSDQGAKFRQCLQKVLPHIGDAYRGEAELFRSHMGASGIAKECGRAIWYGFRWFTPSNFWTGRPEGHSRALLQTDVQTRPCVTGPKSAKLGAYG